MRPLLSVIPKLSLVGIADVRILPTFLSFSCRRKVWGAMHDEPVLTHRFPCQADCRATPNFDLYANGGDGSKVLFCVYVHQAVKLPFLVICILMLSTGMVGYDKVINSIIVAHEGTDIKKL
jgi:hypothetical protein